MHVVFDLDGVLLDSESDLTWLDRALDRTLEAVALADTPTNRSRLFPATTAAFEEIAADAGVTPRELWDIRDSFYREEKRSAIETGELQPFSDVPALYDLDGLDLHIISNSPRDIVRAFVTTNDYEDLFTALIGRDTAYETLDRLKPHPHFYHELIQTTNDPDTTYVYVGHTAGDEQFASATGMQYLGLARADGESLTALPERLR